MVNVENICENIDTIKVHTCSANCTEEKLKVILGQLVSQ